MSQRLIAACVAIPLVVAMLVYAGTQRLQYVTYLPGGTINVLGDNPGHGPTIQVDGHQTYRDDGTLRMTTVSVSPPQPPDDRGISLVTLMSVWLNPGGAVYPYDIVYGDDETQASSKEQGLAQMADSQDYAVEVALSEMGIEVPEVVKVAALLPGYPAKKVLRVGDVLTRVDGQQVTAKNLTSEIAQGSPDDPLRITVERDDERRTFTIAPKENEQGRPLIGITPGLDFDFPFTVHIDIDPTIGGPSAGLMFSLAVYDTLTPGSLTDGASIAGTGEIYPDGSVGPIGGIQQKIAGARGDGATVFLVPAANCADALRADAGDMTLVRASTMHEVRTALDEYAADPDADLPSCEDAA